MKVQNINRNMQVNFKSILVDADNVSLFDRIRANYNLETGYIDLSQKLAQLEYLHNFETDDIPQILESIHGEPESSVYDFSKSMEPVKKVRKVYLEPNESKLFLPKYNELLQALKSASGESKIDILNLFSDFIKQVKEYIGNPTPIPQELFDGEPQKVNDLQVYLDNFRRQTLELFGQEFSKVIQTFIKFSKK